MKMNGRNLCFLISEQDKLFFYCGTHQQEGGTQSFNILLRYKTLSSHFFESHSEGINQEVIYEAFFNFLCNHDVTKKEDPVRLEKIKGRIFCGFI